MTNRPLSDASLGAMHLHLDERAIRAYLHAARVRRITVAEVAKQCGLTPGEAEAVVENLRRVGLLVTSDDNSDELAAVSPAVATMNHVAPLERRVRAEQRRLAELRDELEGLLPAYLDTGPHSSGGVEVLPEPGTAQAVLGELCDACERELLVCQPGGGRPDAVLRQVLERTPDLLRRGARVRLLHQHAAQFAVRTLEDVRKLLPLGAEVRTVGAEVQRILVVDDRAAVIPMHQRSEGAVVLTDRSAVAFVREVFEQSWSSAAPFLTEPDAKQTVLLSDQVKLSILRLLAEGHSDKAIARRLGVAERTCQRHIAEIFARIGARSRFHAGYLAHQAGVLDEERPGS